MQSLVFWLTLTLESKILSKGAEWIVFYLHWTTDTPDCIKMHLLLCFLCKPIVLNVLYECCADMPADWNILYCMLETYVWWTNYKILTHKTGTLS